MKLNSGWVCRWNSTEILVLAPHLCTRIWVGTMISLLKKPLPICQSGWRELQNALLVIHRVVRGPEQGSPCCFADVTRNFKIQQRGWQRGRQQKNNRFYKQNNNFFVHFCQCLHDYDVKIPNFTFHGVRKQPTTKFCFSFHTWIWSLGIQLLEGSATFYKVS